MPRNLVLRSSDRRAERQCGRREAPALSVISALALLLLAACAATPESVDDAAVAAEPVFVEGEAADTAHPLNGVIWDVAAGVEIDARSLALRLPAAV
ncbi:MAG: hypothetical protein AAFQ88_16185, partial [Pseudomonadota bacterium]